MRTIIKTIELSTDISIEISIHDHDGYSLPSQSKQYNLYYRGHDGPPSKVINSTNFFTLEYFGAYRIEVVLGSRFESDLGQIQVLFVELKEVK